MILYYLVLKAWLGVTGLVGLAPSETVLRVPSAVFAVAAAVVVYLLGRRLFGPIAGLVAAGLYLSNFLQMGVAQLARSYSLELFLLARSPGMRSSPRWTRAERPVDGGPSSSPPARSLSMPPCSVGWSCHRRLRHWFCCWCFRGYGVSASALGSVRRS